MNVNHDVESSFLLSEAAVLLALALTSGPRRGTSRCSLGHRGLLLFVLVGRVLDTSDIVACDCISSFTRHN